MDAITLVQRYGKPNYFVTMTCNLIGMRWRQSCCLGRRHKTVQMWWHVCTMLSYWICIIAWLKRDILVLLQLGRTWQSFRRVVYHMSTFNWLWSLGASWRVLIRDGSSGGAGGARAPLPLEIQWSPPKPLLQIWGRRMREREAKVRRRRKPPPLNLFVDPSLVLMTMISIYQQRSSLIPISIYGCMILLSSTWCCDNPPRKILYHNLKPSHFGH
jgi:hypothetical protein